MGNRASTRKPPGLNDDWNNTTQELIETGGDEVIQMTLDEPISLLSQGSYGKVVLAKCKQNERVYAIKFIDLNPPQQDSRSLITKFKDLVYPHDSLNAKHRRQLRNEVALLRGNVGGTRLLLQLAASFPRDNQLCIVTNYQSGGNLAELMKTSGRFPEDLARFYCAEMVAAIGCLHNRGILHRDIKPENFLIDREGHIVLGGFSSAVSESTCHSRDVGNLRYQAPERISKTPYEASSDDWWGLAITLHEMLFGYHPIDVDDYEEYFSNRKSVPIQETEYVKNVHAYSFLRGNLTADPQNRIGYGPKGWWHLLNHSYLAVFDADELRERKVPPPCILPQSMPLKELDAATKAMFPLDCDGFDGKYVDASFNSLCYLPSSKKNLK